MFVYKLNKDIEPLEKRLYYETYYLYVMDILNIKVINDFKKPRLQIYNEK